MAIFMLEQERPELSKDNNGNRSGIEAILGIGGTIGQWRICRYNKRGNALSREKLSSVMGEGKNAVRNHRQPYIFQQH